MIEDLDRVPGMDLNSDENSHQLELVDENPKINQYGGWSLFHSLTTPGTIERFGCQCFTTIQ